MRAKRVNRLQLVLIAIAAVWLTFFAQRATSQIRNQSQEVERLRGQVEKMDEKSQIAALLIEARLTKMETSLDALSKWIYGIGGTVLIQVLQSGIGMVFNLRQKAVGKEQS